MLRDVVVVDLGQRFWALPIELLDGVSLEVLRARAGRPALGTRALARAAGLAAGTPWLRRQALVVWSRRSGAPDFSRAAAGG